MKAHNAGYIFLNEHILVESHNLNPWLPIDQTIKALNLTITQSFLHEKTCLYQCTQSQTMDVSACNFSLLGMRDFLRKAPESMHPQLLRAFHWINWHRQSKYCGQCGAALLAASNSTEKKCESCNLSLFPRFSPAVMVLVQHQDHILLARSAYFLPGVYSALAGFIDIGETAEQAAHREVKEETGIEITDLTYFGSQAWPFPDSLMIAFKATYLSGDLTIAEDELEDAQWFAKDQLPLLPHPSSISRRLIESFLALDREGQ